MQWLQVKLSMLVMRRQTLWNPFSIFGLSILISFSTGWPGSAEAETLKLDDTSLEKIYLQKSLSKKDNDSKLLLNSQIAESLGTAYRWTTGFDLSQENDRTDSTTTFLPVNSIKNRYSAYLGRKFFTGTNTLLELVRTEYKADSSSTNYYQHYLTLTLEQSLNPLWRENFDALTLRYAENELSRANLQVKIDSFKSLRSVVAMYWQIKYLEMSIQESREVFKKYEKLVKTVEAKKNNNYTGAGELEQALAEYSAKKFQLSSDEKNLAQKILDFKNELGLDEKSEIEFDSKLSPVQLPRELQIASTHFSKIKVQNLKVQSAELSKQMASAKNSFKLSAYGKYNPSGLDAESNTSLTEMERSEKNKITIGLKLDYVLDDQASKADLAYKSAQSLLEQQRLQVLETNYASQIKNSYQLMRTSFENIASSEEILKYREIALNELSKSYLQGRTDISILIDAFNKKVTAKLNLTKAYGDYYDSLYAYDEVTDIED